MGANQYPRTCTKMHNTIFHWRNCAARYVLCAPPVAIVFNKDNDDGPTSVKIHANDG